jgi:hypothetical protein
VVCLVSLIVERAYPATADLCFCSQAQFKCLRPNESSHDILAEILVQALGLRIDCRICTRHPGARTGPHASHATGIKLITGHVSKTNRT